MDIIGDILPILIFIVVSIYKMTKNKTDKKDVRTYRGKQAKQVIQSRRAKHFSRRQEPIPMENTANKETTMVSEHGFSSIDKAMQTVNEIEVEDLFKSSDTDIKKEEMIKNNHTIGAGIEKGIEDRITADEIGKSKMMFDKNSIRKAIIMAEILGKPKALKDKKL